MEVASFVISVISILPLIYPWAGRKRKHLYFYYFDGTELVIRKVG